MFGNDNLVVLQSEFKIAESSETARELSAAINAFAEQ
jgi:hypothetical protein